MDKKKSTSGLGYLIGLALGLILGVITGRIILWIAPGIAFGWLLESLMNQEEKTNKKDP